MRSAYYVGAAWLDSMRWRLKAALTSLGSDPLPEPRLAVDPAAPALLLSPHLDDVVINCWSVLTANGDKRVVNVFAGSPPPGFVSRWDRECGAADSAAQVRRRIAEDREVMQSVGVEAAYLDFVEAEYNRRRPTLAALDAAVATVVPRAGVVYAPAALGVAHADHVFVREYARALARRGARVVLYADFPYALRLGRWPRWIREYDGAPAPGQRDDSFWRPAARTFLRQAEVELVTLTPGAAAAKLDAMRRYASQFPALDRDGSLSDAATHAREVFWTLPQPSAAASRRAPAALASERT